MTTDGTRDRLAESYLIERHDHDWYVGDATTAEWEAAYEWADAQLESRGDH